MEFKELREEVYEVNLDLGASGLVVLTWGNASATDENRGVFAIKPSGVPYSELAPSDIVVVDIDTGEPIAGSAKPSSDAPTHRVLYEAFPHCGGIVHTHSTYATSWAQAGESIPCLGTTHADHFAGGIPVTRNLTKTEVEGDYEGASGEVIVEHFSDAALDPLHTPGVLLPHHGPFAWGESARAALHNAIALEAVAHMAFVSRLIAPEGDKIPAHLRRKHFERKHGPDAYYGQGA